MDSILNSTFFFVIALGILISIHEYGHFWVARRCGVKVLTFSIGFGRPLWKRIGHDGVEYVLAMIPLGGYVKMLDENEGDVAPEDIEKAFNRQSLGKRALIALAGPLANLILAVLLYTFVYTVGVDGIKPVVGKVESPSLAERAGLRSNDEILAIDGKAVNSWEVAMFSLLDKYMDKSTTQLLIHDAKSGAETTITIDFSGAFSDDGKIDVLKRMGIEPYYPKIPAVLGEIQADKAAEQAGLQSGDTVIKVAGKPIIDWTDWVKVVRAHPEENIEVVVERQGNIVTAMLLPERKKTDHGDIGYVGVGPDLKVIHALMQKYRVKVSYSLPSAFLKATEKTFDMSLLTLQVIGKILIGEASVSNLSGPLSIAQYAGDTANTGLISFLMFLAVISISLGVLNLLPIPMLDGGHLFYYAIEFFRGQPVPDWVQMIGMKIGIFVLVSLMSVAFYNDILRLFGEG